MKNVTDWKIKLIMILIQNITPKLMEIIKESIQKMDEMAQKTENKFDDFLVTILKIMIKI